jgi:hypothetical protein
MLVNSLQRKGMQQFEWPCYCPKKPPAEKKQQISIPRILQESDKQMVKKAKTRNPIIFYGTSNAFEHSSHPISTKTQSIDSMMIFGVLGPISRLK